MNFSKKNHDFNKKTKTMKKTILTVLTIFAFIISNAQEKANHNTTRSNQTSGIIVKEEIDANDKPAPVIVGFGCDHGVFTTVSVDGGSINFDTYDYIPCMGTWAWIFATPSDKDSSNEDTAKQNELYKRVQKFTEEDFAKAKRIKIKFEKGQDKKELYKWLRLLYKEQNTSGGPNTAIGFNIDGEDDDCDGTIDSKLFIKMSKRGTPDLNMHCCNAVKKSWEDATATAVREASKKAHAKKHLFKKNGITYYYNGDLAKLNKCKTKLKRDKWIAIESFYDNNETKRKRNKNFNRKGERIKRTKF